MEDKTGGPAFPFDTKPVHTTDGNDVILTNSGMTLLDFMAAAALTGLLSAGNGMAMVEDGHIERWAYDHARAMLKERAKEAGK